MRFVVSLSGRPFEVYNHNFIIIFFFDGWGEFYPENPDTFLDWIEIYYAVILKQWNNFKEVTRQ